MTNLFNIRKKIESLSYLAYNKVSGILDNALDNTLKKSQMSPISPIFIWGAGRSGTTLLYDILSLHPSVMCLKVKKRTLQGLWDSNNTSQKISEKIQTLPIPTEGISKFWSGLIPISSPISPGDYANVKLQRKMKREDVTESVKAELHRRYFRLYTDWIWKEKKSYRILDKSPYYINMVDAIDAAFPNSYHVFCVRDPRAVLNSWLRIYRFGYGSSNHDGGVKKIGFWLVVPPGHLEHKDKPLIERLSWQVKTLHELAFSYSDKLKERLKIFHYEWLLSSAHKKIANLFESLELEPFSTLEELIPNSFPDYSPPWPSPSNIVSEPFGKNRCYKDEEIDQLKEVEQLAVKLGYKPFSPGKLF